MPTIQNSINYDLFHNNDSCRFQSCFIKLYADQVRHRWGKSLFWFPHPVLRLADRAWFFLRPTLGSSYWVSSCRLYGPISNCTEVHCRKDFTYTRCVMLLVKLYCHFIVTSLWTISVLRAFYRLAGNLTLDQKSIGLCTVRNNKATENMSEMGGFSTGWGRRWGRPQLRSHQSQPEYLQREACREPNWTWASRSLSKERTTWLQPKGREESRGYSKRWNISKFHKTTPSWSEVFSQDYDAGLKYQQDMVRFLSHKVLLPLDTTDGQGNSTWTQGGARNRALPRATWRAGWKPRDSGPRRFGFQILGTWTPWTFACGSTLGARRVLFLTPTHWDPLVKV